MKKSFLVIVGIFLLLSETHMRSSALFSDDQISPFYTELQKKESTRDRIEGIAQHYAYIAHDLNQRATKLKVTGNHLSAAQETIVKHVQESYHKDLMEVRRVLFSHEHSEYDALMMLCAHFERMTSVVHTQLGGLSKPSRSGNSVPETLRYTESALVYLESSFKTIEPKVPLLEKCKQALLYNFISTKVAPNALFLMGSLGVWKYSARSIRLKMEDIKKHPHKNPLYDYEKIEHNAEVTPKKSWLFEMAQSFVPFRVPENNVYRVRGCEKDPWHGHVCNQRKKNHREEHYNSDPIENCYQCGFGNRCEGDECKDSCYFYQGLKSPSLLNTSAAYLASPFFAVKLLSYSTQLIQDAQIDEYNRRIKEHEKRAEDVRIALEQKKFKVNYEQEIDFSVIKGLKTIIDTEVKMMVDYLKHPFRYKNSMSGTRSMLFYGPPGTGKTLLARALAKESGAPIIEISADDIFDENARDKILASLRMAEEVAINRPEKSAIVYIDEIDCVGGNREGGKLDPDQSRALSNLLAIFDGIEKRNPHIHILILLTTNYYKHIDPALLRPGRIDRKIFIGYPDAPSRVEFFESYLPEADWQFIPELVAKTSGFSGAHIANLVSTAELIASYADKERPDWCDYERALMNCKTELQGEREHVTQM